jgi:hypothetical protein
MYTRIARATHRALELPDCLHVCSIHVTNGESRVSSDLNFASQQHAVWLRQVVSPHGEIADGVHPP